LGNLGNLGDLGDLGDLRDLRDLGNLGDLRDLGWFLREFLRNWFSFFLGTGTVGSAVEVSAREVPVQVFRFKR